MEAMLWREAKINLRVPNISIKPIDRVDIYFLYIVINYQMCLSILIAF